MPVLFHVEQNWGEGGQKRELFHVKQKPDWPKKGEVQKWGNRENGKLFTSKAQKFSTDLLLYGVAGSYRDFRAKTPPQEGLPDFLPGLRKKLSTALCGSPQCMWLASNRPAP